MEQLKPWYVLDLDISNAIRDDVDFDRLLKEKNSAASAPVHLWQYLPDTLNQLYSSDWLNYMKDINLPVVYTMIFWRQANYQHPTIHVDLPHNPNKKSIFGLNWCIGPDNADMVWYNMPDTPGVFDYTETKSRYQYWPTEDGVECNRRCIGSTPTIVRVDIPHNVIMKDLPRLCISCRIGLSSNHWNQAVEFIKPWIIE